MMNLNTMWRVLECLNKDTTHILEDILVKWSANVDDIQFFRSSANFIFTFQMSNKPFFLRFNHESERTIQAIEGELEFVQYLSENDLDIANPVPSLKGSLIESVSSSIGIFHAVVFESLEGKQYDLEELNTGQLFEWGKTLGELHTISSTYTASKSKRSNWQEQLNWVTNNLPKKEKETFELAQKLEQYFQSLPITENNYGLVHFDFELDNLDWQDNKASVLDFDDCGYSWSVADIAFALRDLFEDKSSQIDIDNALFKSFIEGYRSVKPISDETLALLPFFLSFHNLFMFTKLHRTRLKLDHKNIPDWVHQLDKKIENKIDGYRKEFSLIDMPN